MSLSKIISSGSISIKHKDVDVKYLGYVSIGCEIIPDVQLKCIVQRCKTVSLCNGLAFKFSTQLRRCNSTGSLSLN